MSKVSIIVPIFNGEEYLEECLNSIINQTYKDIEIILINDGSKDESLSIISEYQNRDDRIKIINSQNEGVSNTRNKGIDAATSEWIMFVDCDDFLEKKAVERLVNAATDDTDIAISKIKTLSGNKPKVASCKYSGNREFNNREKEELIKSIFYDNHMEKMAYISCVFSKLYKKDFIEKYNIRFCEDLVYGEDGLFVLNAFMKAKKIAFVDNVTYGYRINIKSTMRRFNPKFIQNHTQMLIEYKNYLEKNNKYEKYENEYKYFVLRQLNKYLKSYFFSKENIEGYEELKKEFFKIVESEPYDSVIKSEKIENLHFKRKLMLMLIKMKQFYILKLLYGIGA